MTTEAASIATDEAPDFEFGDDVAAAFFANLTGAEPKKKTAATQEDAEEGTEAPDTETPEAPEETTEEAPEAPASTDPDDAEVEIKVGEEVQKAKIRDLKRLYGQEAALTQKSQALARERQEAEVRAAQAGTAIQAMIGRAQERYRPYAELDMLVLSQRMNTEDFEQLRKDAAAAKADVDFLSSELDGHMRSENTRQTQARAQQAQACIAELSDPARGIPNFGKPLYDEMCSWASSKGLPEVNQIVAPAALRMIHMAMQFEKQQAASKAAEAKTKAAPQKPSKVLKSGPSGSTTHSADRDALNRLRRSGSVDDAAAAFMARLGG